MVNPKLRDRYGGIRWGKKQLLYDIIFRWVHQLKHQKSDCHSVLAKSSRILVPFWKFFQVRQMATFPNGNFFLDKKVATIILYYCGKSILTKSSWMAIFVTAAKLWQADEWTPWHHFQISSSVGTSKVWLALSFDLRYSSLEVQFVIKKTIAVLSTFKETMNR